MIEQSTHSPEFVIPPDSSSRLRREKRATAFAESIARHNAENDVPLEQVISTWAVQKGMAFVDKLLETSTYATLAEREKTAVRNLAAKAIGENWLEKLGFGKSAPKRRNAPSY